MSIKRSTGLKVQEFVQSDRSNPIYDSVLTIVSSQKSIHCYSLTSEAECLLDNHPISTSAGVLLLSTGNWKSRRSSGGDPFAVVPSLSSFVSPTMMRMRTGSDAEPWQQEEVKVGYGTDEAFKGSEIASSESDAELALCEDINVIINRCRDLSDGSRWGAVCMNCSLIFM